MNEFDYIDKLIRDKIENYKVPTKLRWDDLQTKFKAPNTPDKAFFRLGNLIKFLAGTVAVVGGILFFGKNNTNSYKISSIDTYQITLDSLRRPVKKLVPQIINTEKVINFLDEQKQQNVKTENSPDTTIRIFIENDTIFEE